MYKELLEKAQKEKIDIIRMYIAFICSTQMSKDEEDYEEVCEATYNMFVASENKEKENIS